MAKIIIHRLVPGAFNSANRDKEGQPKSAFWAGVNRSRWSSQSQRSAMREWFRTQVDDRQRAWRTAYWHDEAAKIVAQKRFDGQPNDDQKKEIGEVINLMSTYLHGGSAATALERENRGTLYVANLDVLGQIATDYYSPLADIACSLRENMGDNQDKTNTKTKLPSNPIPTREWQNLLDYNGNVEIAAFGRFMANNEGAKVTSPLSGSHAISVGGKSTTNDFFTLIDDIANHSSFLSATENKVDKYDSAVYYSTLAIDTDIFLNNLNNDSDTMLKTLPTLMKAYVLKSTPSGKQNSAFSYAIPSTIAFSVAEEAYNNNAFSAFEKPINEDPSRTATQRILDYLDRCIEITGPSNWGYNGFTSVFTDDDINVPSHIKRSANHDDAYQSVINAVKDLDGIG